MPLFRSTHHLESLSKQRKRVFNEFQIMIFDSLDDYKQSLDCTAYVLNERNKSQQVKQKLT